jgi:hypothetical protein
MSLNILKKLIKEGIEDFVSQQQRETISFEDNPLEYILQKYPSLDAILADLMTENYRDYITGVYVIAPKPTTFRILLHNGQEFYLIYGPKAYTAKISGKKYNLINLNEEQFAINAIASLLELGMPPGSEGPGEQMDNEADTKGGEDLPTEETPAEEPEEELAENEEVKPKSVLRFKIIKEGEEKKNLNLTEASDREINANTAKAIPFFLSKVDSSQGFKPQSDKKRLGDPKKHSSDEMKSYFTDIFQAQNIKVIPPGTAPNPSGKFSMYEFDTEDFGTVRIVVSGGGNEGEKYEQNFVSTAKDLAGTSNKDLPLALQSLYAALKIDNTKLTPNDISFAGGTDTKRNLNFDGPEDIGSTISDITIQYDGNPYYISLKNKSGSGLYSGKNVPFIVMQGDKVVYDASKRDSTSEMGILADMLNIDGDKIAKGLNDYIDQTGPSTSWEAHTIETEKFKNFLASSFGYGYYYVKEAKGGDVKVVPILTAQDALNAVGKLSNIYIKYPGSNTKITAVLVESDSEIFGKSKFLVTLRNTQGKLLPLSLRVSKL